MLKTSAYLIFFNNYSHNTNVYIIIFILVKYLIVGSEQYCVFQKRNYSDVLRSV